MTGNTPDNEKKKEVVLKNHLLKGCTFAATLMLFFICISPLQANEKKADKDTANAKVQVI